MTQAWLRSRAEADLIERTAHYCSVGGGDLGERFFDAALASLRSAERMPGIGSPLVGEMCDMPGIGSPLVGEMCDMPGLRSCQVKGFRVRWCYLIAEDHLDVIRLLADAQDLPAILKTEDNA